MYQRNRTKLELTCLSARACALLLAVWCLAGCSSTGYQKGDVAATGMQAAATEVQVEAQALDQTMASLKALVDEPNGDLRPPFKRFSDSLDHLIATTQRTDNTGKRMREKSAAYFQAWDQQLQGIDYGHIRDVSQARRTEVTNRVEAVSRRYQESQAAVQPLLSYLVDIRKALSIDLTPGGIASLKSVIQNATDNVAKVQTALASLTTELTTSSTMLSSVAYQSQAAEQNPRAR
jgi:hypothetical protein